MNVIPTITEPVNRRGTVGFLVLWHRVLEFLTSVEYLNPIDNRERRGLILQAPDAITVTEIGRSCN